MKKILVIHGPNLNMLGKREAHHYGTLTLQQINDLLAKEAQELGVQLSIFQSNSEGSLIDFIQSQSSDSSGIVINPGALTHYGYALADALTDTKLPIMEVHLSDITKREDFRKIDVLDGVVIDRAMGDKEQSYIAGLQKLVAHIHEGK